MPPWLSTNPEHAHTTLQPISEYVAPRPAGDRIDLADRAHTEHEGVETAVDLTARARTRARARARARERANLQANARTEESPPFASPLPRARMLASDLPAYRRSEELQARPRAVNTKILMDISGHSPAKTLAFVAAAIEQGTLRGFAADGEVRNAFFLSNLQGRPAGVRLDLRDLKRSDLSGTDAPSAHRRRARLSEGAEGEYRSRRDAEHSVIEWRGRSPQVLEPHVDKFARFVYDRPEARNVEIDVFPPERVNDRAAFLSGNANATVSPRGSIRLISKDMAMGRTGGDSDRRKFTWHS